MKTQHTQLHNRKNKHPSEVADSTLALQTLRGNEYAFERLFKRYYPALFQFVFSFLGDYDHTCDVIQHVFLQFYISLPEMDLGDKPLKNWLYRVARNRCLDELKRKKAVCFSDLETLGDEEEDIITTTVPDSDPLPEEVAEQHELRERLLSAICSLPANFRPIVLLRYTDQMTFSEIGRTLKIPEATAKTYFSRAKPLLRALLT